MPIRDGVSNNLVKLEGAFGRVFERAMDWANEDFRREIEAVKWRWPRKTRRSDGSFVESPRDIVDTGGLRDSQKRENQTQLTTDFVWTGGDGQAYASKVHDGWVTKGGVRMPARAFTDATIFRLAKVVDSLIVEEVRSNG